MKKINTGKNIYYKGYALVNFTDLNSREAELVRKWRNSASVRNNSYQNHLIGSKEHRSFINLLRKDKRNFYWLVKNESGKEMGVISLNKIEQIHKRAHLGIYVNPGLNNKGIGRKLIRVLKSLAFEQLKLRTLKLEVISANKRAINFYLKSGFKVEGRLKDYIFRDNKWLDVVLMGINEKKWACMK